MFAMAFIKSSPEVHFELRGFVFQVCFRRVRLMQEVISALQGSKQGSNKALPVPMTGSDEHFHRPWQRHLNLLTVPFVLAGFVVVWQGLVWLGGYPAFILPGPGQVFASFRLAVANGTLPHHTGVTLLEVLSGLLLGLSLATVLGYGLAKSPLLGRLLSPYIVASQSVPVVAVAPLLIIWFGAGHLSKMLICALIVFFPVLVNTVVGIRSVDEGLYDLMRSLKAGRWQMFRLLEVPAALPVLLGGLKISATLSVIGAVVGEFVAADAGLGFLINQARGFFNTPLVFVAVLVLVAMAMSLYGVVSLMEMWLLRWRGEAH
jgi:NitT/TauT family transport system permease protein